MSEIPMRVGKSAGGEMHLAAAVYCVACNMLVELGTDDCPHAVAMGQEYRKRNQPMKHLLEFIQNIPHGGQSLDRALGGFLRKSPNDTPLHKPDRDEDCLRCQAESAWNADVAEPFLFTKAGVEVR